MPICAEVRGSLPCCRLCKWLSGLPRAPSCDLTRTHPRLSCATKSSRSIAVCPREIPRVQPPTPHQRVLDSRRLSSLRLDGALLRTRVRRPSNVKVCEGVGGKTKTFGRTSASAAFGLGVDSRRLHQSQRAKNASLPWPFAFLVEPGRPLVGTPRGVGEENTEETRFGCRSRPRRSPSPSRRPRACCPAPWLTNGKTLPYRGAGNSSSASARTRN